MENRDLIAAQLIEFKKEKIAFRCSKFYVESSVGKSWKLDFENFCLYSDMRNNLLL